MADIIGVAKIKILACKAHGFLKLDFFREFFLEMKVQFFMGIFSPAFRFILMKDQDVHSNRV
jgi:hypothetical protein